MLPPFLQERRENMDEKAKNNARKALEEMNVIEDLVTV